MNDILSAKSRALRVITAIDKRVAVFEYVGNSFSCSTELHGLFGLSLSEWNKVVSDRNSFMKLLLGCTAQIKCDDASVKKYCGIIDKNECYVIINVFVENEDIYGFVIDKTAEVYKKFEMIEEIKRMRQHSQTDSLTGLMNRAGFEDIVRRALKNAPRNGALAIIDMDNFKQVNDTFGHPEGDKVLKAFAEVLLSAAPERHSVVARLGGDEFVIFWSESISRGQLCEKLDGLMQAVHDRFDAEYPEQHLSASIGAVLTETGIDDYESLYENADSALYAVKQNGKGHYRIK